MNKIKMLISSADVKQQDLVDVFGLSSKQAVSNKISTKAFSLQDTIKLCDYLGYELVVKDKNTQATVVTFDMNDIKKD